MRRYSLPVVLPTTLTKAEKATVLTQAVFTGIGVGGGAVLGTYSLVTAKVGAMGSGIGVVVPAALVPYLITGVGIVAALISLPIAYWAYKDNLRNIKLLDEQISKYKQWLAELDQAFEELLTAYLIELIHLRCFQEQADDAAFLASVRKAVIEPAISHSRITAGTEQLMTLAQDFCREVEPALIKRIKEKTISYQEQQQAVKAFIERREQAPAAYPLTRRVGLYIEPKVQPISIKTPLRAGFVGFLGAFGTVMGTSWGLSALIMGGIPALALATSGVGIGILVASIVVGLAVGAAVAYFRHKNVSRAAQKDALEEKNQESNEMMRKLSMEKQIIEIQNRLNKKRHKPNKSDADRHRINQLKTEKHELKRQLMMFGRSTSEADAQAPSSVIAYEKTPLLVK